MSSRIPSLNFATLPLLKFSHHTGPYGTRSHTWTHISHRNDLNFVLRDVRLIDDFGNYDTRRWMKVTGGFEILESQDLSQLVKFSQEHSSSSGSDHPIEIVVKAPFLAMKYPKTKITVRRIQVKFQKESDFVLAVTMLKNIGFSVLDKDSPSNISSISTSNSGLSFPRPSSTGHVSFQDNSSSHGISINSPVKSGLNSLMRPNSTASEYNRDISDHNGVPCYPSRPFSANSSLPAFFPGPSSSAISPFYDSTIHSTADYLSQIEAKNRLMSQSTQSNPTRFDDFKLPVNSDHFTSMSQSLDKNFENQSSEVSGPPIVSPFLQSQADLGMTSEAQMVDLLTSQRSELNIDQSEPVSNVRKPTESHNLWIPPKRELPFARPQTKVRSSSSPFKDFPPLPKPTPVTKENCDNLDNSTSEKSCLSMKEKKQMTKKRAPSRKAATQAHSKKQQDSDKSIIGNQLVIENTKLSSTKKRVASRPASAPSKPLSKRITLKLAPLKKQMTSAPSTCSKSELPKMIDQGTQTQDRPESKEFAPSRDEVNIVIDSPSPGPPPQHYLGLVDDFVMKHKARPSSKELWETPEYINADEEIRRSLVNNFICENLDNKDFLQLCEDVELSWQRIGIGLPT
ncbi:hypothetical protein K3495_g1815 [Podosphaera aphanis]|nr:hypothetical protein K3495_g1815 [Podosphaera aphanis]